MSLTSRGIIVPEDNYVTRSIAPTNAPTTYIDGSLEVVDKEIKPISGDEADKLNTPDSPTSWESVQKETAKDEKELNNIIIGSKSGDIVVNKTGIPYQDKKLGDMIHEYDAKYDNITTSFDYIGASNAGASAKQILDHLKLKGSSFDIDAARRAGASDEEIVNYLATKPKPSPEEKRKFKNEILGKARYGGESDFLLGVKQAGIGIAKTALDLGHLVQVIDDSTYKDTITNLTNKFEQIDSEVANHGFFSANTLGEIVPFLATLPIALESIVATVLIESVAGYAMARGDSSVEESLGWGALGGLTAGAFSILGTHLSGAALEKAANSLEKSLLVNNAEKEEFSIFFKDYIASHEEAFSRKDKAILKGQSLISFKTSKDNSSEIIRNALNHKLWNSQKILDILRSQAEERQRLVGSLIKLDDPEATTKDVVTNLINGQELVKKQYDDLVSSYSTMPSLNNQVIDIVKNEITDWSKLVDVSMSSSEDAKLAADSYKRILSTIENSKGTVGDLIDIEKVINEEARKVKQYSPKSKNISDIKDYISNAIKDNMNANQYNNYLKVKADYARMASVRDSKLGKLLDEIVTINRGTREVYAGGSIEQIASNRAINYTHNNNIAVLDNGARFVELNKNIDDVLDGFSKLKLGSDELSDIQKLLPNDKYVDFEKLLLQNSIIDGSSRVQLEVLGKALQGNKLLTKEGKQVQDIYNILRRFHSYDDVLNKINANGEYIAESTRSGFGATAIAALVRTTVNTVGRVPVIGRLLPNVRQAHLTNKFLKLDQAIIKLNKYSSDLPYSIWQDIITKTEAELSSMDWENKVIETKITPSIPAEEGLVHSRQYINRGSHLASTLAPVLDRAINRLNLDDKWGKELVERMYGAENALLHYHGNVNSIGEALSKSEVLKELTRDITSSTDKASILFNLNRYIKAVKSKKPNLSQTEKLVEEAEAYANLMTSVENGVRKLIKARTIKGQDKAMVKNIENNRLGLAKGNSITRLNVKTSSNMTVVEATNIKKDLFNKYMLDSLPKVNEALVGVPSNKQEIILSGMIPKIKSANTAEQIVKLIDKYNNLTNIPLVKLSEVVKGACK